MDTFQGMTMYDDWRLVPVGAWRAVQRVTRRGIIVVYVYARRALIGNCCIKKIFVCFYRS